MLSTKMARPAELFADPRPADVEPLSDTNAGPKCSDAATRRLTKLCHGNHPSTQLTGLKESPRRSETKASSLSCNARLFMRPIRFFMSKPLQPS